MKETENMEGGIEYFKSRLEVVKIWTMIALGFLGAFGVFGANLVLNSSSIVFISVAIFLVVLIFCGVTYLNKVLSKISYNIKIAEIKEKGLK